MDIDVRDGRLVDWSRRGVPADVHVYEHGEFVAFYKEFGNGVARHVAVKGDVSDTDLEVALRLLDMPRD